MSFNFFSRKSNAERRKDYRSKHPEEVKENNKVYCKDYREKLKTTMTQEEKDLKRMKDRDRKNKSNLIKRQNYDANKAQKSSFLTPQVKGKLKKRTKEALNGTNDQNFEVLQEILTELDSPDFHKKNGSKCLDQTTIDAVEAFYYNDEPFFTKFK